MDLEQAYLFRHALLRDAAYALQPPEERASLHADAVATMEALFDESARGALCADLAEHAAQARAQDPRRFAALGRKEVAYVMRQALADAAAYRNDKALALLARVRHHPDAEPAQQVQALLESTEILAHLPNPRRAIEPAEEAARMALAMGDTQTWLRARKRVTWVRGATGQSHLALSEQLGLVQAALVENEPSLIAGLLSDMATMQRHVGQYDQSEASLQQALEVSRQLGHERGIGTVELNMGALCMQRGQHAQAARLYRSALARFEPLGNKHLLRTCCSNLSSALAGIDPAESERLAHRALALARETGDVEATADATGKLAMLRKQQGQLPQAEALFRQAIEIQREAGVVKGSGNMLGNLASTLEARGHLEEARRYYSQALEAAQAERHAHAVAYWQVSLASLAASRGDWPEVAARCAAATPEAQASRDPLLGGVVEALLALHDRATGNESQAQARWQRARQSLGSAAAGGAEELESFSRRWQQSGQGQGAQPAPRDN